jgi:hypothetical protein
VLEYDPYDTPPLWLRVTLGGACILLCGLMLLQIVPRGLVTYAVIVVGGLLASGLFITMANTGVKAAMGMLFYIAMLGLMVLFVPM